MKPESSQRRLTHQRNELLKQLEDRLEGPMIVLGFAWLVLLIIELTGRLTPGLATAGTVIWIIFILDFGLKFYLAPGKLAYLRANWLGAISLAVPALRVLRFARVARVMRAARATRGLRLVRILTSINRGIRTLSASFARRGFGYVAALTLVVVLVGAAGMLAFENNMPGSKIVDYGSALWWTAMIMTTMGSEYWPRSAEGRVLCLILSLYAFAMFGYVTATIATFFLGEDARRDTGGLAGSKTVESLRQEIVALRAALQEMQAAGQRTGEGADPKREDE
jgi:voltage-gated potassium channel